MKYLEHEYASGPYPVPVTVCLSEKEWIKAHEIMKREAGPMPTFVGCASAFTSENGAVRVLVTFAPDFKDLTLVERFGAVVHETTHVWQFMRKAIAEDEPGWEVEALALEWISKFLLERLEKKGWMK